MKTRIAPLFALAAGLSAANALEYQDFTYAVNGDSITITDYPDSAWKAAEIPEKIDDKPVTAIADFAFSKCTRLPTITLPQSVKSIGAFAFNDCAGLLNLTIPSGVATIGQGALGGCHSLERISFLGNAPAMGPEVFDKAAKSTIYYKPGAVGFTNPWHGCPTAALSNSGDFSWIATESGAAITGYPATATGIVTIPTEINGQPVTAIGDHAFKDCKDITRVIIPPGVTSIGKEAFAGCGRFTAIIIPASVKSIDSGAFKSFGFANKLIFLGDAPAMGDKVFSSNEGMTVYYQQGRKGFSNPWQDSKTTAVSVSGDIIWSGTAKDVIIVDHTAASGNLTIPAEIDGKPVTGIGRSTFINCTGLTGVTLPDSIKNIGDYAFQGCAGLTGMNLPASVNDLGGSAFKDCTGITTISIPAGVPAIDNFAFDNCTSLTSINLPAGLKKIGAAAFRNCTKLPAVTIPDGVTRISGSAFSDCTALTSMTIPAGVKTIEGGVFQRCMGLTGVTIPASVGTIEDYAFYCCTSLSRVSIPDGVLSIEDSVFMKCEALTSVTIPASVRSIGQEAFSDCKGLTEAIFQGNAPTKMGVSVFAKTAPTFKIRTHPGKTGFTYPSWMDYPCDTDIDANRENGE